MMSAKNEFFLGPLGLPLTLPPTSRLRPAYLPLTLPHTLPLTSNPPNSLRAIQAIRSISKDLQGKAPNLGLPVQS
jgi:hypothetical protein